jgi:type I restriction enzyme S subunit
MNLGAALEEHGLRSNGTSEVHSVSLSKGIVPQVAHMGRSFAAGDTAHYNLVRPFDVVYTRSPLASFPLGIVKQHKGDRSAIVSPLYGVFAPRSRNLGLLIEAYFDSPSRSIRYLDPLAQKGAKNTIQLSNERFLSGSLYLPETEHEQQKIAECLCTLDNLIGAETRKLEALRRHKQGLMQQLFPQPGATTPRLRFSEFEGAPEWDSITLRRVLARPATYGIVKAGQYLDTGVPMVRGGDIKDGTVAEDLLLVSPEIHTQYDRTRLVANDVIIALVGYPGEAAVISERLIGANVSRAVGVLRVTRKMDPHFLAAFLNSPSGRKVVLKPSAGSAQTVVNLSDVNELEVPLPEKSEQERLAHCIGALGALVTAQSQRVDALVRFKRGLLQELFPSPEGP